MNSQFNHPSFQFATPAQQAIDLAITTSDQLEAFTQKMYEQNAKTDAKIQAFADAAKGDVRARSAVNTVREEAKELDSRWTKLERTPAYFLDTKVRMISELALHALMKIDLADGSSHGTGFLISSDGFVLTVSRGRRWTQDEGCIATMTNNMKIPCDHVEDFQEFDLSLLKMGSNVTFPFLQPDEGLNIGDAAVLIGFGLQQTLGWRSARANYLAWANQQRGIGSCSASYGEQQRGNVGWPGCQRKKPWTLLWCGLDRHYD